MPHPRYRRSGLVVGRPVLFLAATGLTLLLTGCRATPGYQGGTAGQRSILARYQYRRLKADLPGAVRVPAAIAAARQALAGRGYAVEQDVTHSSGRVVASAPGSGMLDKVTVTAHEVPGAVRVEIMIDPLGDQTESRAILDAMLARLGM